MTCESIKLLVVIVYLEVVLVFLFIQCFHNCPDLSMVLLSSNTCHFIFSLKLLVLKVWNLLLTYREQLDSLSKLKMPQLMDGNVPWASHTPSCTLQHWSAVGVILTVIPAEKVANSVGHDRERRSVTPWEETESAREDGELPVAPPAPTSSEDPRKTTSNGFSELEHSRGLALITKSLTPTKQLKSQTFSKYDDDSELMLDSESDLEEQTCLDSEPEDASMDIEKPWEDHATREFHLVLSKRDRNDCNIKLEAKVTSISIPSPLSSLSPPYLMHDMQCIPILIDQDQYGISSQASSFWFKRVRWISCQHRMVQ